MPPVDPSQVVLQLSSNEALSLFWFVRHENIRVPRAARWSQFTGFKQARTRRRQAFPVIGDLRIWGGKQDQTIKCVCADKRNHTKGSQTCPVSQSDQHESSWSFIWGHAGYIFFETTDYVSNSELLLQYDPNNTFYSLFNEITIVSLWDLAVIIREKLMELSVIAVLERRDGPARFIVIKCVDSNRNPQFYVSIVL